MKHFTVEMRTKCVVIAAAQEEQGGRVREQRQFMCWQIAWRWMLKEERNCTLTKCTHLPALPVCSTQCQPDTLPLTLSSASTLLYSSRILRKKAAQQIANECRRRVETVKLKIHNNYCFWVISIWFPKKADWDSFGVSWPLAVCPWNKQGNETTKSSNLLTRDKSPRCLSVLHD